MNLNKDILQAIIVAAEKYDSIDKIVIFGSRARGDNEPKSDIDLAIYAEADIFEFIEEVETTTPTLLEFDFSDMRGSKDELFIEQIEKEGIVLYEKCRV